MRRAFSSVLVVLAVIGVFSAALTIGKSRGEFDGTDAAATEEIQAANPAYEPWFEPVWTQPGGEVEAGLFALQASLGAGLLGFALGTLRERHKAARTGGPSSHAPADA